MGNAVFGWFQIALEGLAGVAAGEVAGFGDGVEELEGCGAMDGEVVDGFVDLGVVGDVGGLGEHRKDGFRVRGR